jgi:4-amino-4-deoxy-L-arabinose transferase-like glycosyltransferase
MAGYLPGFERRTYWMPPVYFLTLAPVFGIFGVSAVVMRAFSAAGGVAVMALTFAIARRVGLSRVTAALAIAVLSVDAVFLRGARLGRMDMLSTTLVCAALLVALAMTDRRGAMIAGVLASLAALTHPLGMIAPISIGLYYLTRTDAERWQRVLAFVAAGTVPALLWGAYIATDWHSFSGQFAGTLGRKSSRQPFNAAFLLPAFRHAMEQYNDSGDLRLGNPGAAAQFVWLLGTVGTIILGVRQPAARLLAIAHVVALVAVLLAYEMWYPLYCLPTTALGVAALAGPALHHMPGRQAVSVAVLVVVAWFAARNLAYEEALLSRWSEGGDATDYNQFCDRVSALIPARSRVLVSIFPDVYLCLSRRRDLTFRTFLPESVPLSEATQRRVIDESDVIVTGRWSPGGLADAIARSEGELIGEVGPRRGFAYHALVYRMKRAAAP